MGAGMDIHWCSQEEGRRAGGRQRRGEADTGVVLVKSSW